MFTIKIVDLTATATQITGKLADAELHFTEGLLAGLKLIGFSVWERRGGNGRNVTFPARTYSVNGDRRTFALLRPTGTDAGQASQNDLRDAILTAYAIHAGEVKPGKPGSATPLQPAPLSTISVMEDGQPKELRRYDAPAGGLLGLVHALQGAQ